MTNYSMWAMEFSMLPSLPDLALLYGKGEGARELPFYYVVIQSEDRVILVDAGFSDNEFCADACVQYGVGPFTPPSAILSRIGLTPEDVDTIMISHHHWDHISGLNYFPNATVYLQRREAESWMSLVTEPPKSAWLCGGLDPATGADLVRIGREGRLRLVDGVADVAPGIQIRPAHDTHTPGSQYFVVQANDGGDPWVFAGDTGYLYDNFGGYDGSGPLHPIGLAYGSNVCCIRSTDEMLKTAGGNIARVIPSHEVLLWQRFPSIQHADGNHIAEIQLAPGVASRIGR